MSHRLEISIALIVWGRYIGKSRVPGMFIPTNYEVTGFRKNSLLQQNPY